VLRHHGVILLYFLVLMQALFLLRERLSASKVFTSPSPSSTAPPPVQPPSSILIPDRRQAYETSIDRFLTAVRNTSCCRKPDHIRLEREREREQGELGEQRRKDQMPDYGQDVSAVSIIGAPRPMRFNEEHLSCV